MEKPTIISFILMYISPIVALLAIVINNVTAYCRQKSERSIKFKIDTLESVYSIYNLISEDFLVLLSSVNSRLISIHEEILFFGTENKRYEYEAELDELYKRALFLAVYKKRVIEALKINLNADELALFISDIIREIKSYISVVSYITKLFVVKYYEFVDIEKATETVVMELHQELEMREKLNNKEIQQSQLDDFLFMKKEMIKEYNTIVVTFDSIERHKISSRVKLIINEYLSKLEAHGIKPIEDFDIQISNAIKSLVK